MIGTRLLAGLTKVPGLSLALIMAVFPSGTISQDGIFPPPIVEQVRLRIAAATDREVMKPVIAGFQQLHPEITIDYVEMNTNAVYDAVLGEGRDGYPDLVISSAADLQVKLVNDGYSQPYVSSATRALPDWANWRDEVFGFTFEPAVIVYNSALVPEGEAPRSRDDIRLLRGNMEYMPARRHLLIRAYAAAWRLAQVQPFAFTELFIEELLPLHVAGVLRRQQLEMPGQQAGQVLTAGQAEVLPRWSENRRLARDGGCQPFRLREIGGAIVEQEGAQVVDLLRAGRGPKPPCPPAGHAERQEI